MIPCNLTYAPGTARAPRRSDGMAGVLRRGALLGALCLAACAQQTVTSQQISEVKPLTTTYDQVVATFGIPSAEANLSGGSKVAIYDVREYDRNLYQEVPYLNLTANNYTAMGYDYFIFNRDGVLESFAIPHLARLAGVPDPGS
jgi:hypothetical protein